MFFTFLFVLAVAVFLFSQWIYPLWANKPLFPLFRKRKKKVVLEIKQEETEMTAEKALDLVNFHCERILHFIAVAESYAENEEETAKDKLNRTLATIETVKERAEKIKNINPNKEEGV